MTRNEFQKLFANTPIEQRYTQHPPTGITLMEIYRNIEKSELTIAEQQKEIAIQLWIAEKLISKDYKDK